jgi:glycosyltransferase involved in cell wall biosynthesis
MRDREPLVSVILPTFNREAYLREAVQSVLNQTYSNWELIVIDDGSTDGSRAYLRTVTDHRVRVIKRKHCGNPARLRNAGIAEASGEWVAFLDSDDVWSPEKIEAQVRDLRAHPDCRWSYTYVKRIDQRGAEIPLPPHRRGTPASGWILTKLLTLEAIVTTPAVMVAKDLLARVGGFDESFVFCEEYELWSRLARVSEVSVVPVPLVSVRSHAASYSAGRPEVSGYWVRLYEKVMATTDARDISRLCKRQRAAELVRLANGYRSRGEYRRALDVLLHALRSRPAFLSAWLAALKTCVRPFMPAVAMRAYRFLRESRPGRTPP